MPEGKVENLMDISIVQDVLGRFDGLSPKDPKRLELLMTGILIELRIMNGRTPENQKTKEIKSSAQKALDAITNFRV